MAKKTIWRSIGSWLVKMAQIFSTLFQYIYLLFPNVLFLILGLYAFWALPQGKDLLLISIQEKKWAFTFVMMSMVFWVFVTWYGGRIVVYQKPELYKSTNSMVSFFGQWKWNWDWITKYCISFLLKNCAEYLGYHLPRVMGYLVFAIVFIGIFQLNELFGAVADFVSAQSIWLLLVFLVLYFLLSRLFLKVAQKNVVHIRKFHRAMLIFFIVSLLIPLMVRTVVPAWVYLLIIFLFQCCYLFVAVSRRPMFEHYEKVFEAEERRLRSSSKWYHKWMVNLTDIAKLNFGERRVFLMFNGLALAALIVAGITNASINFANSVGSFSIVMIAFGVLLGFLTLVSTIGIRKKINLHLIVFLLTILMARRELHQVRLSESKVESSFAYDKRPTLKQYFGKWIEKRKSVIDSFSSAGKQFPIVFCLADGGASRSGYWTASVLGKLQDRLNDAQLGANLFEQHLFALSGASGGSVGNGTFLALLQKEGIKEYEKEAKKFMSSDFLSFTLARMLGPDFFAGFKPDFITKINDRAGSLERAMEYGMDDSVQLKGVMAQPFSSFIPDLNANKLLPVICINATRMQDGKPALVSSLMLEEAVFGSRLDILSLVDTLNKENQKTIKEMRLSSCVVLGARFPYISPAGNIGNHYFVDGGYFDNSGAGAVHEMIMAMQSMLNTIDSGRYKEKFSFHVLHITNSPALVEEMKPVNSIVNDLASPIVTIMATRSKQTDVNDQRLRNHLKRTNGTDGSNSYWNIDLYVGKDKKAYPMNWVISKNARDSMDKVLHFSNTNSNGQLRKFCEFILQRNQRL
jgi:hypothetical protein